MAQHRLKLFQVNITANWGSTGKIAEAIGNAAIANGWESFIAYGRVANNSTSHLIKVGGKIDTYIHYLYDRILDMEGRGSVRPTKKLIEQIKAINPDIVQLHNIHDHYLNYPILFEYLNQTNIKVVWTFHDCWAFTGHCYHFAHVGCMKWRACCEKCVQRHMLADRSCENYLIKKQLFSSCNNLTIITCSSWINNFVKQSLFKDKPTHIIHNGINLHEFRVLPYNNTQREKFKIISVSNVWNQSKGLLDLFKLRDMLSSDYEIIIVGLSPDQQYNLPKGIRGVLRTQSSRELVELYNEADVFINLTYADTFPTVNLEALACGTPVITYRTGGSPEAVDCHTGFVVEPGDIYGVRLAIENIEKNGKLFYTKNCRYRAEELFDMDKNYQKYIELYNSLLHK